MSKRDLRRYLKDLDKEQLEGQIIDLYERFTDVKVFYDFVFNPKEDKLLQEFKLKVSNEYFPVQKSGKIKRAKLRRSVAQKFIKHFIKLGVDPFVIADAMLYNLEIAQTYSGEHYIKQETFYNSMLQSFDQTVQFLISNGILNDFKNRIFSIAKESESQKWLNRAGFLKIIDQFHS